MSGDETARVVGITLMIVLIGSSLVSRRLPFMQTLRMIGAWVLIFAIVLVGYSYRYELQSVLRRVSGDLLGERGQTEGGTLRVPIGPDGHFWVRAQVNGETVRFLVDSGATVTAMAKPTAQEANVALLADSRPVQINTANGAVQAHRGRIAHFKLGPITATNMAVVVSSSFGETNVLGMNFLSSLARWKVERGILVLEPTDAN